MTSGLYWIRAKPTDERRIREFLEPRESWACACSGKLRSVSGAFILPHLGRGALYLLVDKASAALRSVVLFTSTGTVLPVFEDQQAPSEGSAPRMLDSLLQKLRTAPIFVLWKPEAAIGLSSHVALLERAFGWNPSLRIAYDMMALESGAPPPVSEPLPGLVIREASAADLEALMPLAMAYDQDEVLTPLHQFNYDACKAGQVRSLSRYRVFVAVLGGHIVGRAQTNATGYAWEQLGGIYVEPEKRGLGIASIVVGALVSKILEAGKRPCLFVKKSNAPARRVYEKLGFSVLDDFSVDYFG